MEEPKFDMKAEYEQLSEKHNLPEFEKIAEDFDIEKLSERETDFLLRGIRRVMSEKIMAYGHLFETLVNPSSPPMFIFKILKNISKTEKQKIQEIYKSFSKIQVETMKLDTIYSEKAEVDFIKKSFDLWQKVKVEIYSLFESFESSLENDEILEEKSYFD